MKLKKYINNPILSPTKKNKWEALSVRNPGAWYEKGTFYLLYCAAGEDKAHVTHFGLATSRDGFHFERVSDQPVLSPSRNGPDSGCIEDPRIMKFGDYFYITYVYRPFPPGQYWLHPENQPCMPFSSKGASRFIRENLATTGMLMTKNLKSFHRLGRITKANLDDRDIVLFPEKINGKYVMLHRPKEWIGKRYSCRAPSIWISFSEDLLTWEEDHLLASAIFSWESKKIGAGPPPVKTKEGWVILYHGVDKKGVYRVGVMLLDCYEPQKVIARAPEPIMEPHQEYELKGLYPRCVFPTGNVVVEDRLFVYYGAADKYCCVATASLSNLLKYVLKFRTKRSM